MNKTLPSICTANKMFFLLILVLLAFALPAIADETPAPAIDENTPPEILLSLAENGDAAAQNDLGVCYHNGTGIAKDEQEAVRWF
ncbi:MAG: SEL1-like repeat protein, partial [Planctomycetaceae bacterium]|nr:SEL1-like repeat protein [Planctomycetaceae bacterium]